MKKLSTVNRFIHLLNTTFDALDRNVPMPDSEQMAFLLHNSMDSGNRLYHTSEHIFKVQEGLGALQTLAVLFHDTVYVQVDEGLPDRSVPLLGDVVEVLENDVHVIGVPDSDNTAFWLCVDVFGKRFENGQIFGTTDGINELLSAVVAVKTLEPYLTLHELTAIAACIEATIPFRGLDENGDSPFDRMARRLPAVSEQYKLDLSADEIDKIVQMAVEVGNHDVRGFALEDPGAFLSDTWVLLPETNAILWSVGAYTIQDYRWALAKMEGFLNWLNPNSVFYQYGDTPSDNVYQHLQKQARRNVLLARDYLGIKLLTIAIIEALALLTGGDAPVSMFLGDIDGSTRSAEDFLPKGPAPTEEAIDKELLDVLETGRAKESRFDLTHSPVSAYVYRSLGTEATHEALADAKAMFLGDMDPEEFLTGLDVEIVNTIGMVCADIAISRREALLKVINE